MVLTWPFLRLCSFCSLSTARASLIYAVLVTFMEIVMLCLPGFLEQTEIVEISSPTPRELSHSRTAIRSMHDSLNVSTLSESLSHAHGSSHHRSKLDLGSNYRCIQRKSLLFSPQIWKISELHSGLHLLLDFQCNDFLQSPVKILEELQLT